MGSYSSSTSSNTSNTAYTNAPVAQENVSNPLNLVNSSGVKLNSGDVNYKVNGGSLSVLDGGAIGKAFDFGSQALSTLANFTRAGNEASMNDSRDTTHGAVTNANGLPVATAWLDKIKPYKNALIISALLVGGFVFYKAAK